MADPFSPRDKLKKKPLPPRWVARATGFPIAKNPSPGCAEMAMMLNGSEISSSPPPAEGRPGIWLALLSATTERAAVPIPNSFKKSRRVE